MKKINRTDVVINDKSVSKCESCHNSIACNILNPYKCENYAESILCSLSALGRNNRYGDTMDVKIKKYKERRK